MLVAEIYRRAIRPILWLLPGFLLFAAFPPIGEKVDVVFALAPLLWLSRQGNVRQSARRWFFNGLFFWVATLSWMPAIVKNGGPWPLVLLGWGALGAYCALYFAAFGYLSAAYWRWCGDRAETPAQAFGLRILGIAVVEPVLWCGLELVRSRFLGGFAWNQLGVVAVNGGFGAPAALGGVYLCSAAILLVNGTVAGIAERWIRSVFRRQDLVPIPNGLRSLETLAAFAVIGAIYLLAPHPAEPGADRIKVAMIQRNFPCVFSDREENPYDIYSKLLEHLLPLRPELVVLPESAMCDFSYVDRNGARAFADWVAKQTEGAAVLAGGSRSAGELKYNSAALYQPAGERYQCYDKVHLVPFGEFIPGDKLVPVLQKLAPVGSCTPGELKLLELKTADGKTVPIAVAICFEDTDSALMRRAAAMGARLLVFITNDSWFSHSIEPVAHAWQATARAVETSLPVVRVGNSGVTGTITPDGRASWLKGPDGLELLDRRATMFDRVALAAPGTMTPYGRFGDIPLAAAFALVLAAMVGTRAVGGSGYGG